MLPQRKRGELAQNHKGDAGDGCTAILPPEILPSDIAATVIDTKAHADEARLHAAYAWLRANNPLGRAEI